MMNEEVLQHTEKNPISLNEQPAAPEKSGKRGHPAPVQDVKGAAHYRALFDIGSDLLALEALIEESNGDISDPVADEAVTRWMADFTQEQALKADNYVALVRKWEAEQSAAKMEKERYAKIEMARVNRIGTLKRRMFEHMQATNQQKIQTATGRSIAIENNGGEVPLLIDFVDPAKVEERFQIKPPPQLNKDAIRGAVLAGEELSFAKLGQRGKSLRIR